MILDSQRAIRSAQGLQFCYLCGKSLADPRNDDHVPPSSIFLTTDRNFPLTLPTHVKCNSDRSAEDQVIGQLIGLLHDKSPNVTHNKLQVNVGKFEDGTPVMAVEGVDLRAIIRRWIRGFHAALYKEFLPETSDSFMTSPPLPEGRSHRNSGEFVPVAEVVQHFVDELKKNRATNTLDRIVCRNGKCRYECVWAQADGGQWMCIYGLDLYDWMNLGDTRNFEARGCVGAYRRPGGGTPRGATRATRLVFAFQNSQPLNPFGE